MNKSNLSLKTKNSYVYLLFFLGMAVVLLFASHCSFLYPISDSVDTNCFLNSAKLMTQGKVLYKDFFEQKGPIIYMLHMLALYMPFNSYHNVYILEVIFATIYCIFIYKTIRLFSTLDNYKNIIMTIAACGFSYFSGYTMYGGEIEEFALPAFAYLIYNIVKYIVKGEQIEKRSYFTAGICAGLIFWSKYTILAPYFCLIAYFVWRCVKSKDHMNLRRMLLYATMGIATVTVIMFVYLFATNSFSDMISVYFKANLFEYKPSDGVWSTNKAVAYIQYFIANLLFMLGLAVNIVAIYLLLYYKAWNKVSKPVSDVLKFVLYGYFSTWAALALYAGGYGYYFMDHSVFTGLIMILLLLYFKQFDRKYDFVATISAMFISMCISFISMVNYSEYKIEYNEFLNVRDRVKSSSLCVMSFLDPGFYYLTDTIPDSYYPFATTARKNVILEKNSEDVKSRKYDYILINDDNDEMQQLCEQCDYVCIYDFISYAQGHIYLYKLNMEEN